MRFKLDKLITRANDLFLSSHEDSDTQKSFLDLFTDPSLKNKSKAEYSRTKSEYVESQASLISYKLDDISSNGENYIIIWQDKSGKTSLLYKINIELLKDYSKLKIVPIYIDAKDYRTESSKVFSWVKLLVNYFRVSNRKAEEIPSLYRIKLLVDNYDIHNDRFNSELSRLINKHDNVNFIICTQELISVSHETIINTSKPYNRIYIYDISRSQIRGLTLKWPSIPIERKEQAIEKILSIFNQLRIPCNYWNVSLFLWIFEKTNSSNIHNNVDLIQLYIEKLLDKESLALDKSIRISFDELKNYLGELSFFLIENYGEHIYTASYSELVEFTDKYKDRNIRFVIDVEDIIKLIEKKGVLVKGKHGRYTFRLNGVFEYFLSVYMDNNPSYRKKAILDDHTYLSFANEFELYAGSNKKDTEFIENILDKTVKIFSTVNARYGDDKYIDENLISKAEDILDIRIQRLFKIADGEIFSLASEEKDALLEEITPLEIEQSEVYVKKYYTEILANSENLEKALKILARVFRNTSIKNVDSSNLILDYILLCSTHLGFVILDESSREAEKDEGSATENKKIMKLWVNFIPLIIQTILYDAVGQDDLERLLLIKLAELKKHVKQNQYLLMLIYLLIIDLNPKRNIRYIDDAIEEVTVGILQSTMLAKLYYYVMFNSYDDKHFETILRNKIKNLIIKINPKTDRNMIEKRIQELDRRSKIEKHRENEG